MPSRRPLCFHSARVALRSLVHALRVLSLVIAFSIPVTAATLNSMRIHSSVTGRGEPTIFLVHGWTCTGDLWGGQVSALAPQYRVVTLDLPGHGRSEAPPGGQFSIGLCARAVETVRADVAAERIVIVGHSLGGSVAIRYAEIHPEHIAGLVLLEGVTGGNIGMMNVRGERFAGPDGMLSRQKFIRKMFQASTPVETQAFILQMMLAAPEATAVRAMDAMVAWIEEDLGVFEFPVLAIYADNSPLSAPDYLNAHFKHIEITEIPSTGHFLMNEKPAELNLLLLAFLAKLKSTSQQSPAPPR